MWDITSEQLLLVAFGLLVVGAIAGCGYSTGWRKSGYAAVVFMAAATVLLWALAVRVLGSGAVETRTFLTIGMLGTSLKFHIDQLSAVFLLVVPLIGLATTLYSVEYMSKVHADASPARYYPFVLLLMAAVVGVVTVSDLFFFFIFWEMMTLTSWVLVWFDRNDEVKVRAAWKYFVVTHAATACMLIAGIVAYSKSGSFAFAEIARAIGEIAQSSPAVVHVLMALFLIGFTTKAGMFPFGGWLPDAYPAAPSPASAMFAGSMTKLGIYGVVRVFLEFLQAPGLTTIWGGIIAILGATSILVGTLTALQQDDSKRLLSFHIIGQIGYMLLGVGTAVFFVQSNPALATVALIAGLYHLVNNACYKPLLFLNVGAAEYYTGTRDLNKIGGLGALMPVTLVAAVIASLSIAGIPPFSGFASKWLIYQSTAHGGLSMPLFLPLCLVAIFISIVTLASFMKLLGSMFLGHIATNGKKVPGDVPLSMRVPQIALSAVCVLLGVMPILPLYLLYGAASDVLGQRPVPGFAEMFGSNVTGITLNFGAGTAGVWNPVYAVVAMVVCGTIAYVIGRSALAPSRETVGWYCGEEFEPDEVRFRAHGFCLTFKDAFAKIYPTIPAPKLGVPLFLQKLADIDSWLYGPLVKVGGRLTERFSRTHTGIPQLYMLWQVVGVILVLVTLFALLKQ